MGEYASIHLLSEAGFVPKVETYPTGNIGVAVDACGHSVGLTFTGANARANLRAYTKTLVEYLLATEPKADPAQLEIQTLEPASDPEAEPRIAAEMDASLATARATAAGLEMIAGALNLPAAEGQKADAA